MTTSVHSEKLFTANDARSERLNLRFALGIPLIVGILSWLAYDIEWHTDVGPDTFFTLPHLFLYAGVAITGLTALFVVLYTTLQLRWGNKIFPDASLSHVLGFGAPTGYIIAGFGSLIFLLFGGYDEWWHGVYGFDVEIVSPPHLGLLFGILINMIGCLLVFAGDGAKRGSGWLPGLAATMAILLGMMSVYLIIFQALPLPVDRYELGAIFLYPLGLLTVASAIRRPGAATLTAILFTAMRQLFFVLVPWATSAYATSLGLFLRDDADQIPEVPLLMPVLLISSAIVVDLLLWLGQRRNWPVRRTVLLAALLAVPLIVLSFIWSGTYAPAMTMLQSQLTFILMPFVGALSGWLGWKAGVVLRQA
jgi:hypothetical protein